MGAEGASAGSPERRQEEQQQQPQQQPPPPPPPPQQQQQQQQRYSLRWNDFHSCMLSSFRHLRDSEDFVDVTLACDGCSFTAHKVVLSACSPYFRRLLKSNPCQHPIVILRDVHHKDMESLLRFMYNGEVHIGQEHLTDFLKTAQLLQIRGLADVSAAAAAAAGPTGQRLNTAADEKISPNSTTMIPWVSTMDHQRAGSDSPPPPKRMRGLDEGGYNPMAEEHGSPGDDGDLPESLLSQALETGPITLTKEKANMDMSYQAQSTAEDSNSSDGDADNSERADAATPKTEPPDYSLGLDDHQPYGTNGNLSAEQARTPPGFPGGLLGLQGLGGLMAGPSGIHNSQNDFVSRRSLDMMRVRATDPRPCPKCGKIYRSAHTLRTHLEDKHTVCPGYRCVLCGTVAKSRNSLHSHMSRQHRGISTKDLPVLPMPAPFDPELASRLLAKAGVKISPAELRARASPTGPRRSDVKLDAKSAYSGATSETGSSICGENDPEDLTISQQARFNAGCQPVAAKTLDPLHGLSKEPYPGPLAPPVPSANTTGSAILDTYLQFITENSVMAGMMNPEQAAAAAAMHAAKLAQQQQQQQHFMEKMQRQMQTADYMLKRGDEIRRGDEDVGNHDGKEEEGEEESEEEYSDDEGSGPEGLKAGE